MPGTLEHFWQEHARGWKVHMSQHSQLIEAEMEVVQEYKRRGQLGLGGALSAVRAQCIWASCRTRNQYFVVLGESLVFDNRYLDASSA